MTIHLPLPPIGAKIFATAPAWAAEVAPWRGVSFCEAVSAAATRGELWVGPNSLTTCHWAPIVLGFAEPQTAFQQSLEPTLPFITPGVLLAPVDRFRDGQTPDVVIVRAGAETLREMAARAGWDNAAWEHVEDKRIAKSALRELRDDGGDWRTTFSHLFNRTLAALEKAPGWKPLTLFVFQNRRASGAFEEFIKRALASMSLCRNSLVIPYQTGKFNVSNFCAGGMTWGGNYPFHMTSGWPWALWRKMSPDIAW